MTDTSIMQVSPFMAQLAIAKEPEQTRKMEATAAAAMAWAKENENYEAYTTSWYAYVMARRRTTELVLPYIQHGDHGLQNRDDIDVISVSTLSDFGFSAKQWQRRKQELEADVDEYYNECIASGSQPTLAALYEIVKNHNIKAKRDEMAKHGEEIKKTEGQLWKVFHGDIRTWIPAQEYDFIITDPPYPKEYLDLWSVLAERASKWLKPGGLLVAMSGHLYLPEIFARMSEHLDYFWTGSYLTPGQSASNYVNHINQQWKPLLMWQRRDQHHQGRAFSDVFRSDANDKNLHHWGQSESGMYDIVSKVCHPGQSILDPFAGSGTTLVAAVKYGCPVHGLELESTNVDIMKGRLHDITA
jgi:16S rRNA G966 N2-methylase RsmD